eukprot:168051_1
MRTIMITDFVIDNKNPRFCKTLLFDYYPTRDNNIKIELILSNDINNIPIGSININIMYLLTKHNGYLCVPITNKYLCKKRRSLSDLHSLSIHKSYEIDTCIIVTATTYMDINNNKHQILPKFGLPINLKIMKWTDRKS